MFDFFRKNKIKKIQKANELSISMALLSKDSLLFYSQVKSGTTYTVIFLINYINEIYELGLDHKGIFDILPYFHCTAQTVKKTSAANLIEKQSKLAPKEKLPLFIHTHIPISDFSDKRVLLTRNPLDYLVSSYFFFYINQGKEVKIEKIWKRRIDKYIRNEKEFQKIIENQPESSILIKYEDLVSKPLIVFTQIIKHFELPLDPIKVQLAINKSQKKEIINIEKSGGKVIIAPDSFMGRSFIRSGEIGDWKNHISPELANKIKAYISSQGIDLNNYKFE